MIAIELFSMENLELEKNGTSIPNPQFKYPSSAL